MDTRMCFYFYTMKFEGVVRPRYEVSEMHYGAVADFKNFFKYLPDEVTKIFVYVDGNVWIWKLNQGWIKGNAKEVEHFEFSLKMIGIDINVYNKKTAD